MKGYSLLLILCVTLLGCKKDDSKSTQVNLKKTAPTDTSATSLITPELASVNSTLPSETVSNFVSVLLDPAILALKWEFLDSLRQAYNTISFPNDSSFLERETSDFLFGTKSENSESMLVLDLSYSKPNDSSLGGLRQGLVTSCPIDSFSIHAISADFTKKMNKIENAHWFGDIGNGIWKSQDYYYFVEINHEDNCLTIVAVEKTVYEADYD